MTHPFTRNLFTLGLVGLALLFITEVSAQDKGPPNIIYLMLDEWGYFESGHMGHKVLLTPNIDQFAAEGMGLIMPWPVHLFVGLLDAPF